jgi:UDP-sulfoquinovose synthase
MRILILGGDGYLGWPTAMYFSSKGHEVKILDNYSKRKIELEENVMPLNNVLNMQMRSDIWNASNKNKISNAIVDLTDFKLLDKILKQFQPESIIHYGQQPSAPYSMKSRKTCVFTQENNIIGNLNLLFAINANCPESHLVKLGTMGEYGTPNIDIEEGYLTIEHNGRADTFLYPKTPGSFYHLSKVADSNNIFFACKMWGLRATDLNQGVVYGLDTEHTDQIKGINTSFHYDDIFGTVINRFLTQAAIGHPLTVYGKGNQTRGYLNILDTIKCVEIACNNPPEKGKFNIFNQFTEQFSINQIADLVIDAGKSIGIKISKMNVENPRIEKEEHYYNAKNEKFKNLGLKPNLLSVDFLAKELTKTVKLKHNVNEDKIQPKVLWNKNI